MLFPLPDGKNATAVRDALEATVQKLPEHLWRSLTWDQGKDMAQHAQFTIDTGIKMHVHSVFVLKDGEPHIDKLRTRCVGGPTILP